MKKMKMFALVAGAAVAFGGVFASCSSDPETKTEYVEKKVDKNYAASVTFSVADDAAGTGKSVTLASETADAKIYYTVNGATPTSGSTEYTAAISVTADTTIKAIAVKEGLETSPASVANISIKTNEVIVYKDSENAVGSEITIDGTTYYVISNNLSSVNNASRAATESESEETDVTGLVDTGDTETDLAIEKFASDVYVRKFLAEVGITKYIQVWAPSANTKDSNAASSNGIVTFSDKFPILDAEKNKIADFKQHFDSRYLITNLHDRGIEGFTSIDTSDKEAMSAAFNKITEGELRTNYEPNAFTVSTYPSDVSKMIEIKRTYAYDENGEVALTKANLIQTDIENDYQTVTIDSESKNLSSYRYTFDDDGYAYNLLYKDKQWYQFKNSDKYSTADRRLYIMSKGDVLKGDNNESTYKCAVDIHFGHKTDSKNYNYTYTPWIQVSVSGTNATAAVSYKIQPAEIDSDKNWLDTVVRVQDGSGDVEGFALSDGKTLRQVLESDMFKKYITFTDSTKTLSNGYIVPSRIYIKARYKDEYLDGKDFTKVTLVPDTSDTTGVVYKEINRNASDDAENVPAFVNIYSANFPEIIAQTYSTSTPTYSVSFFNPANATESDTYPNLKASAGDADYSALATISEASFAWGSELAGIVAGDAAAAAPTVSAPAAKTIENVITGAQFESQSGKLDVAKGTSSSGTILFSEKDADVAVLSFTVTAKKDLSLLSLSNSVYFNKSRNFYADVEIDGASIGQAACDSNGVATCVFSAGKKSLTAGNTATVKIIVRGAKNLYASQSDDFAYRAIFTPVTLTFKKINAGVN